jgi:hypothetical protein
MLSVFKILFLAFFDVCRFKKKPQDIPESKNLLTFCAMVFVVLSVFLANFFQPFENAVLSAVIELVLIMIFTLALLQIRGKASRWPQTVTAFFGTNIIVSVIALPVYIFLGFGGLNEVETNSIKAMGLLFLAGLSLWNIVIMGYILKHALEIHFAITLFIAMVYIWIIFSFESALMPMGIN